MRADQYLYYLIGDEMTKRYEPGASGTIIGRMHGETHDNGYLTGYQMLHGSNATVGDLEYFGVVTPNIDGSRTFDLIMTFHDIMDPNYGYRDDRVGDGLYPGTPYTVHITWSMSFTVAPPNVSHNTGR